MLYKAVCLGEELMRGGERLAGVILEEMRSVLKSEPLANIDYVEMVDADSIEPIDRAEGRTLVAMAVYIGTTRLIDNFIFEA